MTDPKYYESRIATLEARRSAYMRSGKLTEIPAIDAQIASMRERIEALKPKPVTEMFSHEEITKSGLNLLVLEAYLGADFLADISGHIKKAVKRLGCNAASFIPELTDLITRINNFCDSVYGLNEDLTTIMEDDGTLIEALHKKTLKHIQQRILNFEKQQQS